MVEPGLVLPYLAKLFDVEPPNYVVGVELPKNVLGMYDPDTQTIYFRDVSPPIYVIAHEFGHHLHTVYGIKLSNPELEDIANLVEYAVSNFYGVTPKYYGLRLPFGAIFSAVSIASGLALIFLGVFKR